VRMAGLCCRPAVTVTASDTSVVAQITKRITTAA
jgi:hypothetical protein